MLIFEVGITSAGQLFRRPSVARIYAHPCTFVFADNFDMTITYTAKVATSSFFCFLRLLAR